MSDPKSRTRVMRLLRGDIRSDDLTALFLYARDHCDGREAVADIGHFIAHHTQRSKGIVTRATRDWFAVVRYYMWLTANGQLRSFTRPVLPPSAKEYLRIAPSMIGGKRIRAATGCQSERAAEVLAYLSSRLTLNPDQSWTLPADLTQLEWRVLNCVSSVMVIKPAFTADRLIDDFIETLKSNGLITKDEIRAGHQLLSSVVPLFAVSAMHNTIVQVDDQTSTRLEGSIDSKRGEICIMAATSDFVAPGAIASPMFTASVDLASYCHPDLVGLSKWDFDIELGPDGRLAPLR